MAPAAAQSLATAAVAAANEIGANVQEGWEKLGNRAYYPALVFTLLACILTARSMIAHLKAYRRPDVQRLILRIFWMVPIYAVSSLVSLRAKAVADYIEAVRDLYEAFVIYVFFNLLVEYLGGERELAYTLRGRLATPHTFPVSLFSRGWDVGNPKVFLSMKRGILQFVLLKPIFTFLTMVLKQIDWYQEGYISWTSGYVWISFFYNVSVSWSLYCLMMFYVTCAEDLKPYRPLPKFLCIKAVIFFSFWQGIVISILVYLGIIQESGGYSTDNISQALQDFLVCFEMLVASYAHGWAFSPDDYSPDSPAFLPASYTSTHTIVRPARLPFTVALRDALGTADIAADVHHTIQGTRFAALSTAEHLLDVLKAHQRQSRWGRWLAKVGIRRRFAGERVRSSDDPRSDEDEFDQAAAAPLFEADGSAGSPVWTDHDDDESGSDTDLPPHTSPLLSNLRRPVETDALLARSASPSAPVVTYESLAPAVSSMMGAPSSRSDSESGIELELDPVDERLYHDAVTVARVADFNYPVIEDIAFPGRVLPVPRPPGRPIAPASTPVGRPARARSVERREAANLHPYRAAALVAAGVGGGEAPGGGLAPASLRADGAAVLGTSPGGVGASAAGALSPNGLRRVAAIGPPPVEYNPL
ncbi:hypothetical protein AMAG_07180 [Allomyces macrogynus ATCC 38327]|uniref:DUF300-domain-containing protein n=1 Tax=Allomyces macrogynus (strain ATCC 38327) TaxID=578462 RepID=A0A0L0SHD7_ALLM3|nr:hypothetical protein AMAG_07180 [Allomyces macrogynus ATCC 38327]|eukprot:KNE61911.1 hypothetical protein AMAG_07180 [Allomyces macrogynus ATCC 38327]